MLLVLVVSNMKRWASVLFVGASMVLLLAACGSDAIENAQVASVAPTPVATTAPLAVPTPTAVPEPTSTPLPAATPTVLPTATAVPPAPTVPPAATPEPAPSPTPAAEVASAPAEAPTATVEVVEPPTSVPTATAEAAAPAAEDASSSEPTAVAETPTVVPTATTAAVVVASGEPPLECYDTEVRVYRGFVDQVDALSFENGRVFCTGAGTNAVSAARSYRHASGLIVQRNADYIFNSDGTGYIPYSGFMHFCMGGQPVSAPITADSVPRLLVVIDNEAQRLLAEGAVRPANFTSSGTQC